MPLDPTPIRARLRKFLSPRMVEAILTETKDKKDWQKLVPTPGTRHPDTTKYPNHIFAFATSSDDQGLKDIWVYVQEIASQEAYNFEASVADIGENRYDAVQRTYLHLRLTHTPATTQAAWVSTTPTMGTAMATTSPGNFTGSYVLAKREQRRTNDDELDSIFVVEVRTYIKRTPLSEVELSIISGRSKRSVTNIYYRTETIGGVAVETLAADPGNAYWGLQADGTFRELKQVSSNWFEIAESSALPANPINGSTNPAKTRVTERVTPDGTDLIFYETGAMPTPIPAYGSAHYSEADYKLSFIEPADETGLLYRFYYVKARATEDPYNWEYTDADLGGQKFKAVKRTYVTLRASFTTATPIMGTAMASAVAGLTAADYILAYREQVRTNERKIDNLFVIDVQTYVARTTIRQLGVDPLNGQNLTKSFTLRYATESVAGSAMVDLAASPFNPYWGIQSTGIQRTFEQLTANWYSVMEEQIIGGVVNTDGVTVRIYLTNENYYWPPVLNDLVFKTWARRDGGSDIFPTAKFNPEGYSGPCATSVVMTWAKDPFTIAKVGQMLPTRIYYGAPFFTLNLPECLHPSIDVVCDIGTTDPTYAQNVGSTENFPATNYTVWPSTIVAYDEQVPYRGGYLRTTKTVAKPA